MKKIIAFLSICFALLCGLQAASVTLAWDNNCDSNAIGTKIYWSASQTPTMTNVVAASTNYCGDVQEAMTNVFYGAYTNQLVVPDRGTTATVSNLVRGQFYSFYATAYSASGLESDPSNVVTFTIPELTYIGLRLEWWTTMASISRSNFNVTAFTNPPPRQFYRSLLVITNKPSSPVPVADIKVRLEWWTNLANVNRQTFDLISFTNPPVRFYRSYLVITNSPF